MRAAQLQLGRQASHGLTKSPDCCTADKPASGLGSSCACVMLCSGNQNMICSAHWGTRLLSQMLQRCAPGLYIWSGADQRALSTLHNRVHRETLAVSVTRAHSLKNRLPTPGANQV